MFNFGNIDQPFAFLGIVGLVVSFITLNLKRTLKILLLDILCFTLLASPIVKRMTAVPIELFDYRAFIIPATMFVLCYIFSLYHSVIQYLQSKKAVM